MTGRAIVLLAVTATGLLVAGARLLEAPTTATLMLGLVALCGGTASAAAAVAGAWRSPAPRDAEAGARRADAMPTAPRREPSSR